MDTIETLNRKLNNSISYLKQIDKHLGECYDYLIHIINLCAIQEEIPILTKKINDCIHTKSKCQEHGGNSMRSPADFAIGGSSFDYFFENPASASNNIDNLLDLYNIKTIEVLKQYYCDKTIENEYELMMDYFNTINCNSISTSLEELIHMYEKSAGNLFHLYNAIYQDLKQCNFIDVNSIFNESSKNSDIQEICGVFRNFERLKFQIENYFKLIERSKIICIMSNSLVKVCKNCGSIMVEDEVNIRIICKKCGIFYTRHTAELSDISIQDKLPEHQRFLKSWIMNIFGFATLNLSEEEISFLKSKARLVLQKKKILSADDIRTILKKIRRTDLNRYCTNIILICTDGEQSPPYLSSQNESAIIEKCTKIMMLREVINKGAKKCYYPFWIYVSILMIFGSKDELAGVRNFIHFQSKKVHTRNCMELQEICKLPEAAEYGIKYISVNF